MNEDSVPPSSIISCEGVQSSFHECMASCGNEDAEPSLMPFITFTPPLVASSAEEQCIDRSRTKTLIDVDSYSQLSSECCNTFEKGLSQFPKFVPKIFLVKIKISSTS